MTITSLTDAQMARTLCYGDGCAYSYGGEPPGDPGPCMECDGEGVLCPTSIRAAQRAVEEMDAS